MKVKRPERPIDPPEWPRRPNVRLRAELMAGADEESRTRTGRPIARDEVERAQLRYPGDV